MANLKQDMQKLRDFFSGPEKWTKGSQKGLAFCLQDACTQVCRQDKRMDARHLIMHMSALLPAKFQNPSEDRTKVGGYVGSFNDDPETTFETVVSFLDMCVEKAS